MSVSTTRKNLYNSILASGIARDEFAQSSGVPPSVLGDFLNGSRKPQKKTVTRIETEMEKRGWLHTAHQEGVELTLKDSFTVRPTEKEKKRAQNRSYYKRVLKDKRQKAKVTTPFDIRPSLVDLIVQITKLPLSEELKEECIVYLITEAK